MNGEGIAVTSVTEPLVSMFGKEMRPGSSTASALLWEEITDISLSAMNFEPDGVRWLTLTVNATCGEYFEVHEGAEGFAEAVVDLCQISGIPTPEVTTLSTVEMVLWPCPAHDPSR